MLVPQGTTDTLLDVNRKAQSGGLGCSDLGPSCLGRRSDSSDTGRTDLSLPGCHCCGLHRTIQELTESFLQPLDTLLEVGCCAKLFWR
jgi:hypothetical protein